MAFMVATPLHRPRRNIDDDDDSNGFRPDPNLDRRDKAPVFLLDGDTYIATNVRSIYYRDVETRPIIMTQSGPIAVYVTGMGKIYLIAISRNELLERTYRFIGQCTRDLAYATRNLIMWQKGRDTDEERRVLQDRSRHARAVANDVTTRFEEGYIQHQLSDLIEEGVATGLTLLRDISAFEPTYKVHATDAFVRRNRALFSAAHAEYHRQAYSVGQEYDDDVAYM